MNQDFLIDAILTFIFPALFFKLFSEHHFVMTFKGHVSRNVSRALSNMKAGWFCENSQQLKTVDYFRKTLYLRCLAAF